MNLNIKLNIKQNDIKTVKISIALHNTVVLKSFEILKVKKAYVCRLGAWEI